MQDGDNDYVFTRSNPHMITQIELNDPFRDLNLFKEKSKILGSRLQEWNLLAKETKISVNRNREQVFSYIFQVILHIVMILMI